MRNGFAFPDLGFISILANEEKLTVRFYVDSLGGEPFGTQNFEKMS
jgi:hypothetical protein